MSDNCMGSYFAKWATSSMQPAPPRQGLSGIFASLCMTLALILIAVRIFLLPFFMVDVCIAVVLTWFFGRMDDARDEMMAYEEYQRKCKTSLLTKLKQDLYADPRVVAELSANRDYMKDGDDGTTLVFTKGQVQASVACAYNQRFPYPEATPTLREGFMDFVSSAESKHTLALYSLVFGLVYVCVEIEEKVKTLTCIQKIYTKAFPVCDEETIREILASRRRHASPNQHYYQLRLLSSFIVDDLLSPSLSGIHARDTVVGLLKERFLLMERD